MKRRPRFMHRLSDRFQRIANGTRCKGAPCINDLPIELLLKIFDYLSPSDLLRCSRTCRLWCEGCSQNDLWRAQFKRLPVKIQKLSLEAKKPTSKVNWKKETVFCLKKSRKKHTSLLLKKKNRYSALPEKTTEAIKYLDVRWTIVITDAGGNEHEIPSKDVTYYTTSFTVCWNDIDLPPVGRLVSCSIYAQCPVFRLANGVAVENSVSTRSLFAKVSLKGDAFDEVNLLGRDFQVSSYGLTSGIVFGLWHEDIMVYRNVAFITIHMHSLHIVERILNGTSSKSCIGVPHQPMLDDLDGKYGLQRYSALIELRTSRKLLWNHKVLEFLRGHVEDGHLIMTDERAAYQSCFDIHKPILLPWKAGAIKGIIKNLAVLDFSLIDCNDEFIWHTSEATKASPVKTTEVNFECDSNENLSMVLNDKEKGSLTLNIAVDPDSDSCAVRRIQVRLKISFINNWFGTSY